MRSSLLSQTRATAQAIRRPLASASILLVAFAAFSAGDLSGALVASYTFGPDGTTPSILTPTFEDPNLTATPITGGTGAILDLTNPATLPPTAPYLRFAFTVASTTPAAAITNNAYFEFTLTADPGFELDLNFLNFDVMRGGAGTPRGFDVRSSTDNFEATLLQMDVPTARPTFTNVNIDLTAPSFQNLPAITFRVYSYSPGTGSSVDYDNIRVDGTVVPEPSAALVFLAGLGITAGVRRVRRA